MGAVDEYIDLLKDDVVQMEWEDESCIQIVIVVVVVSTKRVIIRSLAKLLLFSKKGKRTRIVVSILVIISSSFSSNLHPICIRLEASFPARFLNHDPSCSSSQMDSAMLHQAYHS